MSGTNKQDSPLSMSPVVMIFLIYLLCAQYQFLLPLFSKSLFITRRRKLPNRDFPRGLLLHHAKDLINCDLVQVVLDQSVFMPHPDCLETLQIGDTFFRIIPALPN